MKSLIVLLASLVLVAGCSGRSMDLTPFMENSAPTEKPDNPGEDPVSLAEVHEQILAVKCVGCHGGPSPAARLDLSTVETSAEALIEKPSLGNPDVFFVKPGHADPESSYLMAKLTELPDWRRGSRMPMGGSALSEEELELITTWIKQGAKQ